MTAAPEPAALDLVARLAANREDRARFTAKERAASGIGMTAGTGGPVGFTMEEIFRLWECDREGLALAEQIVAELRAAVEYNRAVQESYG